jgi:hypothetical protein
LLVASSGRTVRRTLSVTGLDRALALYDDLPGAVAAAGAVGVHPDRHESPQD